MNLKDPERFQVNEGAISQTFQEIIDRMEKKDLKMISILLNFVGDLAKAGFSLIPQHLRSCFRFHYLLKPTIILAIEANRKKIGETGLLQKCYPLLDNEDQEVIVAVLRAFGNSVAGTRWFFF